MGTVTFWHQKSSRWMSSLPTGAADMSAISWALAVFSLSIGFPENDLSCKKPRKKIKWVWSWKSWKPMKWLVSGRCATLILLITVPGTFSSVVSYRTKCSPKNHRLISWKLSTHWRWATCWLFRSEGPLLTWRTAGGKNVAQSGAHSVKILKSYLMQLHLRTVDTSVPGQHFPARRAGKPADSGPEMPGQMCIEILYA